MNDRRDAAAFPPPDAPGTDGITEAPSPEAAAPAAPTPRKRSWRGPLGMAAALVLAFAWGALTYRELGTGARMTAGAVAVAGAESAPAWVGDFADAFCTGDAEHLAGRIGPPLDGQQAEIANALESREWTCADARYLGGGTNSSGEFYAYITIDDDGGEQWWVFTVADEKIVSIE